MGERKIGLACVDEKGRPLGYKKMLKLTKGLLNQIPNILCFLGKSSGSMILAIVVALRKFGLLTLSIYRYYAGSHWSAFGDMMKEIENTKPKED